jgi:hypothetical protein
MAQVKIDLEDVDTDDLLNSLKYRDDIVEADIEELKTNLLSNIPELEVNEKKSFENILAKRNYVYVDCDVEDYLEDVDTDDLVEELETRSDYKPEDSLCEEDLMPTLEYDWEKLDFIKDNLTDLRNIPDEHGLYCAKMRIFSYQCNNYDDPTEYDMNITLEDIKYLGTLIDLIK